MINPLYNISDWTIFNGVTEDNDTYKDNQPSLKFVSGAPSYIIKDLGRHHNEAFVSWINVDTAADLDFMFLIGCNDLGNGFAVHLTRDTIRLINIVTYAETAELVSNSVPFLYIPDAEFFQVKILIINTKIQIFVNNQLILEYLEFVKIDNHIGFHNNTSTTNTYVSDTIWYDDHILWGNVNVNGANNSTGWILLYKQSGIDFMDNTYTDEQGGWALFIDEDSIHQTKHILVGGITSDKTLQPRGISSVTL